ncbi:hypothetical protein HZP32_05615 [Elizabethkingia anophelis]|nr:hypothetical protein [Elizabethkingia anophelis]
MKGLPKPLTASQINTLNGLKQKQSEGKITEKQTITLGDLLKKKNAKPELSDGAKTYLKEIYKDIVFGRSKDIQSKYLIKGLSVEQANIDQYNEVRGLFLMKNEERFENDYFTGEPDIIEDGIVYDFKSSWDYSTFPLFEEDVPNEDYEYQLQAYMDLLGLNAAKLVYGLVDTPDELILDEKRKTGWKLGFVDGLPEELEAEISHNMTYEDIPKQARIKEFDVVRCDKTIALMKTMIDQARSYLNSLTITLGTHLEVA